MLFLFAPTLKNTSLALRTGVEQREVDWLCNLVALRMSTDPYIHTVSWTPWGQQWTTQAAGDESTWTTVVFAYKNTRTQISTKKEELYMYKNSLCNWLYINWWSSWRKYMDFYLHSVHRAEAMQDNEACIFITAESDSKWLQNQQLHMTEQKDTAN